MSEMAEALVKFRSLLDDAVLLAVKLSEVEGDVDPFMAREYSFALARLAEKGLIERAD